MSHSPEKAETLPWVKITDISPTHDRDHRFNIARSIPTHGWSPDLLLAYRNTTHKHSFFLFFFILFFYFFYYSRVFLFFFFLLASQSTTQNPVFPSIALPFSCLSFTWRFQY